MSFDKVLKLKKTHTKKQIHWQTDKLADSLALRITERHQEPYETVLCMFVAYKAMIEYSNLNGFIKAGSP